MSELWLPLIERESASAPHLRDYVPASLVAPLRHWIYTTALLHSSLVNRVVVRCDLSLETEGSGHEDVHPADHLAYWTGIEQLLNVTDALLNLVPTFGWSKPPAAADLPPWQVAVTALASTSDAQVREPLQQLLDDARSVYTIRADGRALVRRIDPSVTALLDAAGEAAQKPDRGSATRHLQQATDAAYALHPDPVKAYSEAIKAVESAAHATLQPKHAKATLGTMLGEFRQVRDKLSVPISGANGTEGVDAVEKMMSLLWTGQTSRHGNLQETRDETEAEALMAVHLAAVLVQLFASGSVHRS